MKHVILGTAGHVDHGKTALVRALTGIDTDRLPEEKERGISIELGFAPLRYGDELLVGIVDVPGHEKFIRNMVAGATGVDIVMLCIAADEGMKPQTTEHINICNILGIQKGIVAVTKVDLANQSMLEKLRGEIVEITKKTPFEGSEIVRTSIKDDKNLDLLKSVIRETALSVKEKRNDGYFRLPIDRVFSVKGFGTVVTGTSLRGTIKIGDKVSVYSKGLEPLVSTVRRIESFGKHVASTGGGLRLGINLSGIDVEAVHRGDVLGTPEKVIQTKAFDAWVTVIKDSGVTVKSNQRFKIAFGTTEENCILTILGKEKNLTLKHGEEGFSKIVLDEQNFVEFGERFVLRSLTPIKTIGGGIILDPLSKRMVVDYNDYLEELEFLRKMDLKDSILVFVKRSRLAGLSKETIRILLDRVFKKEQIEEALKELVNSKRLIEILEEGLILSKENIGFLENEIKRKVVLFCKSHPLERGMKMEELKQSFCKITSGVVLDSVIGILIANGSLARDKDLVKVSGEDSHLTELQKKKIVEILELLSQGGVSPPTFKDILVTLKVLEPELKNYLKFLEHREDVIRVSPELYYHAEVIKDLERLLVKVIKEKGLITVSDFKNMTEASRKYSIPLLEYFDRCKITLRRVDDTRVLGPSAKN